MKSVAPRRVVERRRYERVPRNYVVALSDSMGRSLLRGHSADISMGGVRVLGMMNRKVSVDKRVWVEITLPGIGGSSRSEPDVLKMAGEVRRVEKLADWKTVSVVFESLLPLPIA